MKNRFYYYQLLDEREEQQLHKAGAESFHISIGLLFLAYFILVLAPNFFNPSMLLAIIIIGNFYFINRARSLGVTYYSRFHFTILYSSKIKFKPRQLHLAVLKYSLRLAS